MKNLKLLTFFLSLILLPIFFLIKKANAKTEYIIKFEQEMNSGTYLLKKDKLFMKCLLTSDYGTTYILWADKCTFLQEPKESFDITYTRWMSTEEEIAKFFGRAEIVSSDLRTGIYYDTQGNKVTYDDWYNKGTSKKNQAINNISNQQWHTYKLNMQDLTAMYKNKLPEGKPLGATIGIGIAGLQFPSLTPSLEDKRFIITLTILEDGTLKQNIAYEWKNKYKDDLINPH